MNPIRALKAAHELMTDDSGRYEVAMGTAYTFLGAFVAGLDVVHRDWLHAALMLAVAVIGHRWATANIMRRELWRIHALRERTES